VAAEAGGKVRLTHADNNDAGTLKAFAAHPGALSDKHLQAYLDGFAFRHNRRNADGHCASRPDPSSSSSCVRR
jgi:hypothetical protein